MKVFLDSSALVKRYIKEPGTEIVADICLNASEIAVSVISIVEVLSPCNRLVREGLITHDQYNWIKNEFLQDIDNAVIVDQTGEVLEYAISCLERGAIRSLDAIHIGSAAMYGADLFVTGDARQIVMASEVGLQVTSC